MVSTHFFVHSVCCAVLCCCYFFFFTSLLCLRFDFERCAKTKWRNVDLFQRWNTQFLFIYLFIFVSTLASTCNAVNDMDVSVSVAAAAAAAAVVAVDVVVIVISLYICVCINCCMLFSSLVGRSNGAMCFENWLCLRKRNHIIHLIMNVVSTGNVCALQCVLAKCVWKRAHTLARHFDAPSDRIN